MTIRICTVHDLKGPEMLALKIPQVLKARGGIDIYHVLAIEDARVVGFWAFDRPYIQWPDGSRVIASSFTYVVKRLRRTGLATKMWDHGVRFWRPGVIRVSVASSAGHAFVRRAVKRYARVGVTVEADFYQEDVEANLREYQEILSEIARDPVAAREFLKGPAASGVVAASSAKVH